MLRFVPLLPDDGFTPNSVPSEHSRPVPLVYGTYYTRILTAKIPLRVVHLPFGHARGGTSAVSAQPNSQGLFKGYDDCKQLPERTIVSLQLWHCNIGGVQDKSKSLTKEYSTVGIHPGLQSRVRESVPVFMVERCPSRRSAESSSGRGGVLKDG